MKCCHAGDCFNGVSMSRSFSANFISPSLTRFWASCAGGVAGGEPGCVGGGAGVDPLGCGGGGSGIGEECWGSDGDSPVGPLSEGDRSGSPPSGRKPLPPKRSSQSFHSSS